MLKRDFRSCVELATICFDNLFTKADKKKLGTELELATDYDFGVVYFVAEIDGKIIGLVGYSQSMMDWETYEFFWLCVDPSYRGKGIGKALVRHCENYILTGQKNGASVTIIFSCLKELVPYYKNNGYKVFVKKAGGLEVLMGKSIVNS